MGLPLGLTGTSSKNFLANNASYRPNLSLATRTFIGMDWSQALPDEIDLGFDHFSGLQSAAQAELCSLIQAADISQTWMGDGARSLSEWVAVRLRARPETARFLVAVARRLIDFPVLTERFSKGELSLDQVDAISRMATPDTEAGLIEQAMGLSNAALDRAARRANPPIARDERTVWERRTLWLQWNLDESELKLGGQLPAAEGEIVQQALESGADRFGPNPDTGLFDPYPARLADALVELAATTGDVSTPPQVTLHADLDTLTTADRGVAELFHGALVPNQTARRLCCDAVVETVVYRDDIVVGVGRNSRTIPGWLRRLVYHRDGGRCQFPGCQNTRWLQVHHRQYWLDQGPTDLENLILLCGFHHRFVHEHGWHITGPPGGEVTFRRPDWTPYPKPKEQLEPRLAALVGRQC